MLIVRVQHFDGKTIARMADKDAFLIKVLDYCLDHNINTCVYRYIDPYDDTTFNRLMAQDLIKDIRLLMSYDFAQEGIKTLKELEYLCSVAIEYTHTYLIFDGD